MMKQFFNIIWIPGMILLMLNCAGKGDQTEKSTVTVKEKFEVTDTVKQNLRSDTLKTVREQKQYKLTFIELGSVRCIPCQMMQPIMKSIEEKYSDQVKVVFYDVWTPEGRPFADQYKIEVIPTQVFLDKNGEEFFRHPGYFPEEELIKVLQSKGVK